MKKFSQYIKKSPNTEFQCLEILIYIGEKRISTVSNNFMER